MESLYVIDQHYSSLKYCPPDEANRKIERSPTNAEILANWTGERTREYYARKYLEVCEQHIRDNCKVPGWIGSRKHSAILYYRSRYAYRLMKIEDAKFEAEQEEFSRKQAEYRAKLKQKSA